MISWQSYSPSEQRCRRLVRRIVHSFMTPEHAVVIDAVLRNTANRGLSTPQIVEIIKLCRRTTQLKLNDMFRAGFVFCESSKDASGKARVGANLQQFFVFDYRKFVTRLAYRNLMVHEKFEAEAQKAAPEEKYFCVNSDCADFEHPISIHEALLRQSRTGTKNFVCDWCGQELEQYQPLEANQVEPIHNLRARLNEQLGWIYQELRTITELMQKEEEEAKKEAEEQAAAASSGASRNQSLKHSGERRFVVNLQNESKKRKSAANLKKQNRQVAVPWTEAPKESSSAEGQDGYSIKGTLKSELPEVSNDLSEEYLESRLKIAPQEFDDEVKRQERSISQNGSVIHQIIRNSSEHLNSMDVDRPSENNSSIHFSFQGTSKPLNCIDQFDIDSMNDNEYDDYCALTASASS